MPEYSIEAIKEAITLANEGEVAIAFPGLLPEVPDWGAFINLIDEEIHGPASMGAPQSPLEERWINGVIIRNLFYLTVRIRKKESIKEIKALDALFSEVFNRELQPVGAFVNIIGGEKPGEAHKDNRETIFWQCQGVSEWTIYEDPSEEQYDNSMLKVVKVIKLRPGDVLYLRNGGMHSVKNFGPRASIALMPQAK